MNGANIKFGWPHVTVRLSTIAWVFFFASSVSCVHGQIAPESLRGTELSMAIRIGDALRALGHPAIFSKEELSRARGLEVIVASDNRDLSFEVVEFTLSSLVGDSFMEAVSHDRYFTDEQRRFFHTVPSDTKIYFENIRVVDSRGSINFMPAGVVIVK
ncbi:MAG: hypothetical protein KA175_16155 [Flavobacteriales bacterium]|nr:hypothetical protein [Flavobacteriales bacterium]MBP6699156.1 hypothetical protein [Flavobacteriales bacterium]